jgi:hypothetical protein
VAHSDQCATLQTCNATYSAKAKRHLLARDPAGVNLLRYACYLTPLSVVHTTWFFSRSFNDAARIEALLAMDERMIGHLHGAAEENHKETPHIRCPTEYLHK